MPIIKTVLKNVNQQAVVKLVGDGTATITSLDIATATQTVDQPNVQITVTGAVWSTAGSLPIVVSRNGTTTLLLSGNDNWSFTQMFGFADTSNVNSNISVGLPANSTIILHLSKPAGFVSPSQQTKY